MQEPRSRRAFLGEFATASAALAFGSHFAAAGRTQASTQAPFESSWHTSPDRVWAGRDMWANPLQDWRVEGGRLECLTAAPDRNVHLLTRELGEHVGTVAMSVRLGRLDGGAVAAGKGSAGFAVGVKGPLNEYRNNLIFGTGLAAGLGAGGELFIGRDAASPMVRVALGDAAAVDLHLGIEPQGEMNRIWLEARDPVGNSVFGRVERTGLAASRLAGNLSLVVNLGPASGLTEESDRWWFADWRVAGSKVVVHEERAFGPLWFNQYTLHARTLKMSVQLPPLGPDDEPTVRLQLRRDGTWYTVAEGDIDPAARNALLRVEDWDDTRDTPYRIVYTLRERDGGAAEHHLEGTVRRDPVDRDVLTVADISCNAHYAFPNTACAASIAALDPDLLAFTGDQYYESTGRYGVDRGGGDRSALDVLRKWAMHGWTWREVLRDRPSVSIPDDHDVYHGNLWGEGGVAAPGHDGVAESKGGYKMTADFVNTVHRLQTVHHPDSSAAAGHQGITGYFGPLTYGRVSFAILADRQYKSAPDGKVPPTTSGRADHVTDPGFDPEVADLPDLELLGGPQEMFLRDWALDWRGADMKAAISQTIFSAMATHHGPKDLRLIADYDTNAWPQSPRNRALRELRKVFAFHLAGDQHLPAVVHYGIDAHRDAVVAFASPAVNNLYSRRFRPEGTDRTTGDFRDSFGHPLTVLACANPQATFRPGVLDAEMDKSAGFGVVRFDRRALTITVECWPLLADPLQPGSQFPGWPVVVSQLDNYARQAVAYLPALRTGAADRPLIDVVEEATGETVYRLRLPSEGWRPPVFAAGRYTLRISEPDTGRSLELTGVMAGTGSAPPIDIWSG